VTEVSRPLPEEESLEFRDVRGGGQQRVVATRLVGHGGRAFPCVGVGVAPGVFHGTVADLGKPQRPVLFPAGLGGHLQPAPGTGEQFGVGRGCLVGERVVGIQADGVQVVPEPEVFELFPPVGGVGQLAAVNDPYFPDDLPPAVGVLEGSSRSARVA